MSGLLALTALTGFFAYLWANPRAGRKAAVKMGWKDVASVIMLAVILGGVQ